MKFRVKTIGFSGANRKRIALLVNDKKENDDDYESAYVIGSLAKDLVRGDTVTVTVGKCKKAEPPKPEPAPVPKKKAAPKKATKRKATKKAKKKRKKK